MNIEDGPVAFKAKEEMEEILRLLRRCRLRLTSLNLHHAAASADIVVQLLKQSIAAGEKRPPQP
jgi:hypothetical protein